jgi:hypothetical protein
MIPGWLRSPCTLAQLLQRALGGMARLEAFLVPLGGAAMMVGIRNDGCHVAASACFESKRNRRHFECEVSTMRGCVGEVRAR